MKYPTTPDPTDPDGTLREIFESAYQDSLPAHRMQAISSNLYKKRLKNLQSSIKSCTACSLHKFCKQPVPFTAPSAPVSPMCVIVSDRPTQEDSRFLEPVSGSYGRYFRSILSTCSTPLDPSCRLLTVSCRHPNREPHVAEKTACRENLDRSIDLLSPWLILSLGGQTIKTFHPLLSVTKDRGKFFRTIINERSYWVLATYSPAYVMKQQELYPGPKSECPTFIEFKEDLQLASSACYIASQLGGVVVDGIMGIVPAESPAGIEKLNAKTYLDKMDDKEHEKITNEIENIVF